MAAIKPSSIPFDTSNAVLAFCLYIAGTPFLTDEKGRKIPCRNLYSKEILNKLGFHDMPIEEAVDAAFAAKKKGHVEYRFQQSKQLPRLLKLFRKQKDELKQGVGVEGFERTAALEILKDVAKGDAQPDEALSRLAHIILTMSPEFKALWRKVVPRMQLSNPGSVKKFKETKQIRTKNGTVTVPVTGTISPGFKIVPRNVGEKVKEDLKI